MKNASDIFKDMPDGSGFVDGTVLDSLQPLVLCSDRLPEESGTYAIKHNGGCNDGDGEMYFSTETGWDIPDMIKSFYRVIGWYPQNSHG